MTVAIPADGSRAIRKDSTKSDDLYRSKREQDKDEVWQHKVLMAIVATLIHTPGCLKHSQESSVNGTENRG